MGTNETRITNIKIPIFYGDVQRPQLMIVKNYGV